MNRLLALACLATLALCAVYDHTLVLVLMVLHTALRVGRAAAA